MGSAVSAPLNKEEIVLAEMEERGLDELPIPDQNAQVDASIVEESMEEIEEESMLQVRT